MTTLTLLLLNVLIIFHILALLLPRALSESELVSYLDDDDDYIDLSGYDTALFRNNSPDCKMIGERVAAYNHHPNVSLSNPEELGSYFEGDILFPIMSEQKNGLRNSSRRWRQAIVPYVIEGDFKQKEVAVIRNSFKEYHARTCVRFKKRTNEKDFISIQNFQCGCFSSIGRVGGKQVVNLQGPCVRHGTILHELMHVIGFLHEHSRHDRNRYVRVMWNNVYPDHRRDFKKSNSTYSNSFGIKYSYASILHYSAIAFSSNGKPTLVPLEEISKGELMGQREKFSESDVKRINAMYKCT